MTTNKTKWLLAGLVCLALSAACAPQDAGRGDVLGAMTWMTSTVSGVEALQGGDFAKAEKHFAVALREAKGFGPEDPRLADSLNNLAAAYHAQGRYNEAEPLYDQALAIREKILGSEHALVGQNQNNLAELYRNQHRYAEAETLQMRALAVRENALGPKHPDVGESLNNLALNYHTQGRYAEAEPLYRRALEIVENALGPEHPHVAQSLENYANLLRSTGRGAEAAKLETRAEAIRAKHARDNPIK